MNAFSRSKGVRADDLGARPSRLVVKPGKPQMVRDWTQPACCLYDVLATQYVGYEAADGFPELLSAGAFVVGLDLHDCL